MKVQWQVKWGKAAAVSDFVVDVAFSNVLLWSDTETR